MALVDRSVMKLRFRSLGSKDTFKLDFPDPCSLPQLLWILADHLSPPAPPGASFRLSLNRTDELRSPDPTASLQSLGFVSGDLIYYSVCPDGCASSPAGDSSSSPDFSAGASGRVSLGHEDMDSEDPPGARPREVADLVPEDAQGADASGSGGDPGSSVPGNVDFEGDGILAADGSAGVRSKFFEPYFLRRVLREELGEHGGDHRLLVIAVHAVMLESGFVAVDLATGMRADRLYLPAQWLSKQFSMPLQYSLPQLVVGTQSLNISERVELKFHIGGPFISVRGSLAEAQLLPHGLCLDEHRFAPIMDAMWAKGDDNVEVNEDGGSLKSSFEKEVFEFWKIVKDGLALPLLIDLTERVGLPLPSCFTCLPSDLKLSIFKLLPAIDLARVECVSSELRHFKSNDELWKQKYVEEFGEHNNDFCDVRELGEPNNDFCDVRELGEPNNQLYYIGKLSESYYIVNLSELGDIEFQKGSKYRVSSGVKTTWKQRFTFEVMKKRHWKSGWQQMPAYVDRPFCSCLDPFNWARYRLVETINSVPGSSSFGPALNRVQFRRKFILTRKINMVTIQAC